MNEGPDHAVHSSVHLTTLDGQTLDVACPPGRSVLDAAADAGYLLPSLCRNGTCGVCHAIVTEGTYDYLGPRPRLLGGVQGGTADTLLCCTHPLSPLTISLPYERSRIVSGLIAERAATITVLERLTPDLVQLVVRLEESAELGDGAEFEPGQFAQLRVPGTDESRAYSYANAPNWEGELEFFIRLRPGGYFSGYLDRQARVGDRLDVIGPQGAFGLAETGLRPRWFIAGGTGVAPLLSMARRMAEFQEPHPLRFYFGADTRAQLWVADAVWDLSLRLPLLDPVLCVKEPAPPAGLRSGRMIDALRRDLGALRAVGGVCPDLYTCGPPGLVEAVEQAVSDHGIPPDRILSERFTSSRTVPAPERVHRLTAAEQSPDEG